jgi:hypothetical protein
LTRWYHHHHYYIHPFENYQTLNINHKYNITLLYKTIESGLICMKTNNHYVFPYCKHVLTHNFIEKWLAIYVIILLGACVTYTGTFDMWWLIQWPLIFFCRSSIFFLLIRRQRNLLF